MRSCPSRAHMALRFPGVISTPSVISSSVMHVVEATASRTTDRS